MTNFIPIFPLNLVVYPGEQLNLHIFEPRYKQLIAECYREKKPFGIPAVVAGKLQEYGTLMQITEITNVNEAGEMDIKTRGDKVFRVLEVIKEIPDKLYCGAIVNYPRNFHSVKPQTVTLIVSAVRELHKLLQVTKDFKKPDEELTSYDVAHHVGFTLEEEYELLPLMEERQRMEYLRRHLAKGLPQAAEADSLRQRIQMNGHFKNLSGFDL